MKTCFSILAFVCLSTQLSGTSITCSLNGGAAPPGGCYAAASSFSPTDFLDWGSANAFGLATDPTTSNSQSNPHNAATPWNASSNGGFGVSVTLGPGAQSNYIGRVDNTALAWNPSLGWVSPDSVSQAHYSDNVLTFAGHFGGPPINDPNSYNPAFTEFGDHGIATTNGDGSITGGGPMILSFSSTIAAAGFRISSVSGSNNTTFNAIVTAKDSLGATIGTYTIDAVGSGGTCAGLNQGQFNNPIACDDAPWIGYIDNLGRVASLTIEVKDSTNTVDVPYMLTTLQLNTSQPVNGGATPEPAAFVMVGTGILALAVRRKRK